MQKARKVYYTDAHMWQKSTLWSDDVRNVRRLILSSLSFEFLWRSMTFGMLFTHFFSILHPLTGVILVEVAPSITNSDVHFHKEVDSQYYTAGQQIRSKIDSFQNANFLIAQPNSMLLPLIGIVSERRFQWGSHHRVWFWYKKVIMKTVLFTIS